MRPKPQIQIPVHKFDEHKFFSDNKVKPPVQPPSQEIFTVELRNSLERLSASKSSEKRVERKQTQRDHPV